MREYKVKITKEQKEHSLRRDKIFFKIAYLSIKENTLESYEKYLKKNMFFKVDELDKLFEKIDEFGIRHKDRFILHCLIEMEFSIKSAKRILENWQDDENKDEIKYEKI